MSPVQVTAVMIAALLCASGTVAASDEAVIQAVWKPQHVAFTYTGTTTSYTCRELASKLKRVLQTLGAHDDIIVDRSSCSESRASQLRVRFRSPVPATPENIALITTYGATERLVARLNEQSLPTAAELPRFAAAWQEVSLSRDQRLRLDPLDCQFVDDVRRQMLPRMAATTLSNRLFCTPGYPGITRPKLNVRVLLATATPDR